MAKDADTRLQVGCIVDTVGEVLTVDDQQFAPSPRCAAGSSDFVAGLGKLADRVLILLEIDKVIGDSSPALVGQVA